MKTHHASPVRTPEAKTRKPQDVRAQLGDQLHPNQSLDLLKALHILTVDGHINQDSRRKLKQVNHLVQFIEKLVQAVQQASGLDHPVTLADHGAGKSYLGFVLYDLYFKALAHGTVYGVESRTELVQKSRQLAAQLQFDRMVFCDQTVADAMDNPLLPAQIDIVTALHACDTATDDAIAFGLAKQARHFAIVPCCQAEVAACLRQTKALTLAKTPLAELWRHPLHTREFGSQLTNVLRCLYLQAQGYQVTVTELVGWEHSLKNELIIASYTGKRDTKSFERIRAILDETGLSAALGHRFGVRFV